MNGFLNKCKIPRIPPLLINNTYVTCCKEKAIIFNSFFAKQCTPLVTNSILPALNFHTDKRLTSINITHAEIQDILSTLTTNKAHGPDDISVSMIKLCGNHLCIPLQIIFQSILKTGVFPDQWKEANVTPVHKKKTNRSYRTTDLYLCSQFLLRFSKEFYLKIFIIFSLKTAL